VRGAVVYMSSSVTQQCVNGCLGRQTQTNDERKRSRPCGLIACSPPWHINNTFESPIHRPIAPCASYINFTSRTNTSHGISRDRSLSVKTNAKPQSSATAVSSDVKLFVTNLRLLDLDLRNDWPGITVQTFSAKNADQRQRIGGSEWALFRLFEIWDPDETAQVR
jgi:hypothetical protein